MFIERDGSRRFVGFTLEREFYHSVNNSVKVFLGEFSRLYGFDNVPIVHSPVAGHFEVITRLYGLYAVVHSAPVADDDTLEAPFLA